jgi:A/G-specific adenine glycosylase
MDQLLSDTSFAGILLEWYRLNKRDLPWRQTSDPYRVWLSEIILQQTRIDQGLPYYERFVEQFPTVNDLASAPLQEVLKCWQGLGYYSRARNLHETAKVIASRPGSRFPSSYGEIRALKGIGDYTAAAVASISFGLAYPVVDGNVIRFLSRYYGIREPANSQAVKKAVYAKALAAIEGSHPGDFNQAMMEFGALHCRPANPGCETCPFRDTCFAFRRNLVAELPVKGKKQEQRTRHLHYLVMVTGDGTRVLMQKRGHSDIWKDLYDFPLIETEGPASLSQLTGHPQWKTLTGNHDGKGIERSGIHRHILTHQVILARFYRWSPGPEQVEGTLAADRLLLETLPVPRLIERYLRNEKFLL